MQTLTIAPFNVIGIAVRTTNENGQAAKDIGALWHRFMEEKVAEQIPHKVDSTVYSIYTAYESDHTRPYTAILACKVHRLDSIPEGMVGRAFEGGNYAKLTAKGDLSQGLIVKQWQAIWDMPLDRAFTADFEVFGEKAQNPNNAEIDFLIALN